MSFRFEDPEATPPSGHQCQPRYERIECDGPGRYFLVYRLPTGEQVRVQLAPGRLPLEPA